MKEASIVQKFTQDVIKIIKAIPSGKVMSYGEIAKWAGHPRNARQVSYILHSMTNKHELPWHRVINSKGKISMTGECYDVQKGLLEEEGIIFSKKDSISFKTYGYVPLDIMSIDLLDIDF